MRSAIEEEDIQHAVRLIGDLWEELRGARIFLTGGTGFFGTSLLETFAHANESLDLRASVVVLSRNPEAFRQNHPDLALNPSIQFHTGDVKTFDYPEGPFTYVIHGAATSALETFQNADIIAKFDTLVSGTRRVLELTAASGAKKFVYTSSGVVYGQQPPEITHIPESYSGAPATTNITTLPAWGTSKRTAEFLCACYGAKYGFEVKIARCFSFAGPGLPLDLHYAIGNFIRDAMGGRPIQILGDGTPRRSYLYISDLMAWLWTILLKGANGSTYNVGSEQDVSIGELAHLVAQSVDRPVEVRIAKTPVPGAPPDRYVPSTNKARAELGLRETIDLKEAILRMMAAQSVKPAAGRRP